MNVLNISKGFDTGGWGHRLTEAFARQAPEVTFNSFYAPNGFLYIDYPRSQKWDSREIRRLWAEADVVHLHNNFATAKLFERNGKLRPAVVHFHGTAFRQNPRAHLEHMRRRGAQGIVSTLDLYLISPGEVEWLPSPYNLEWLRSLSTRTPTGP